jgi:transposase InsO family protein
VTEKYEFIDAEYTAKLDNNVADAPTIVRMCTWLSVSRSGYYEWLNRPMSNTAKRREDLKIKIRALFDYYHQTYGYRRMHAELVRAGEQVSAELVRKLMRELGLVPCQPRPYKTTTVRGAESAHVPDLVRRDFTAERPGCKLVGDITYISTWEGWVYLATIIDCFNKEIIGYAMAEHMRAHLVIDALEMAERNHVLEPGCIVHHDHGTQYTSAAYAAKLADHKLQLSLGRTGICFDNALAESFNGMLKTERVHRATYPTRKKAKEDIANYIEIFYNRRRIHSGLGYRTPHEVRTEYLNEQQAA